MKKISLLYPEVYEISRYGKARKEFPPFGILYLASVAEHSGFSVKILKISNNNYAKDLRSYNIVAFSIPSSVTYGLVKKSILLSKFNEYSLVLLGGLHATLYPIETLKDIKPDILVHGFGELILRKILEQEEKRDFSKIHNIFYLSGGRYVSTKKTNSQIDINTLPYPARHLLPEEDIIMSNRLSNTIYRMTHVMFTRGCSFSCNFCSSGNRYVQFRCPVSIRNELIFLKEKYKIEGFAIVDDNAIINKKKIMEYCASIKDLNLKWSALSRVDTVNSEILENMSSSGCIEIKFGIESGSQKMLDLMNKKISLDQTKHTVRLTKHFGIKVKAFIIHGFPGEDLETTQETIQLLKEIHQFIDRITIFRFVPLPGSPVYENYIKFNIHGTHYHEDWDGNWSRFRIYNNDTHWWGSQDDYLIVKKSYKLLNEYIKSIFPNEI